MPADVPIIMTLDDVTVALDAQRDRQANGISPIADGMMLGRSVRIGMIYGVHANCLTSAAVRLNTENVLVTGAQGEDIALLARSLGLDAAQAHRLRNLRPGELVISAPATWPTPLYGQFPYLTACVESAILEAEARAFLAQVKTVEGKEEKEEVKDSLYPEALRLLIQAGFHIYLGVTAHYRRAGLDRIAGRRAQEFLHARGLITPIKVASGKRGGQLTLIEVTPLGWNELTSRGMAKPAAVTRGGFLHNAGALALGELGKQQGDNVQYERRFGDTYADVSLQSKDGRLRVYQIGLSDPAWEARSAKELLACPGINELHLVVRDKAFLTKVTKLLRQELTAEELKRVNLQCLGDVLTQVQE